MFSVERAAYRSRRPRRNVRPDRRLHGLGVEAAPGEQGRRLAAPAEAGRQRHRAFVLGLQGAHGGRCDIAVDPPAGEVVQDRRVTVAPSSERSRARRSDPVVVDVADAFQRLERLPARRFRNARPLEAGVELLPRPVPVRERPGR